MIIFFIITKNTILLELYLWISVFLNLELIYTLILAIKPEQKHEIASLFTFYLDLYQENEIVCWSKAVRCLTVYLSLRL